MSIEAGTARSVHKGWVSVPLAGLALSIWVLVSASSPFSLVDLGPLGLVSALPWTFWMALLPLLASILTAHAAFRNGWNHGLPQTVVLVLILWGTPLAVGASYAFFWHSYAFYGFTDYILREGILNQAALWYHSSPGAWILLTVVMRVLGTSEPDLAFRLTPLFSQIVLLPLYYAFFRRMIGSSDKIILWAAVWVAYLSNWTGLNLFLPSGIGVLLYMTLLLLAIAVAQVPGDRGALGGSVIALVFVVGAIAVTHLLTTLAVLVILAGMALVGTRALRLVTLVAGVIAALWSLYWAWPFVGSQLQLKAGSLLDLRELFAASIVERVGTGSPDRQVVVKIRLLFSTVLGLLSLAGMLLTLANMRKPTDPGIRRSTRVSLAGLASLAALGVLLGGPFGHETPERLFLFSVPFMAYFISRLARGRAGPVALATVFMLLVPMHLVAHYGNQTVDYVSPEQVAGLSFFHDFTTGGSVLTVAPYGLARRHEDYVVTMIEYVYPGTSFVAPEARTDVEGFLRGAAAGRDGRCYVQLSGLEERWMLFRYNDATFVPTLRDEVERAAIRAYSNGDSVIYSCGS